MKEPRVSAYVKQTKYKATYWSSSAKVQHFYFIILKLNKSLNKPQLLTRVLYFLFLVDIWSDSTGLEGLSDYCIHTEEPFLKTLLRSSFNTDSFTSPLLELTDQL